MSDADIRLSPHATFWLLFFALCLIALLLFSDILLPFAAGMVIAYLFRPIMRRLCRAGVQRAVAAFAIIAVLSLAMVAAAALVVPPILDQMSKLIENTPTYLQEARHYIWTHYGSYLEPFAKQAHPVKPGEQEQNVSQQVAQNLAPWVVTQLQKLFYNSLALFNSLALLFITPVVTFFLLRDWDTMVSHISRLLPRQDAPAITQLAAEIDDTISAYLRGQLIVLLILSALYMVALGVVGLNYGLLIGLGAGLISFVPFLGSTVGFIVAGGVAVAQYWPDYGQIALVLVIFVAGQQLEGNVLTPKIVGDRVGLHPVWLLFALIASGYLLGFTGLLIAVPLAAAIGVLVRYAVRQYYKSEAYDETNAVEESQPEKIPA